jgi:hypothetical protein
MLKLSSEKTSPQSWLVSIPHLALRLALTQALGCLGAVTEHDVDNSASSLSLAGTATASSVEAAQFAAERAVDGDTSTRWSSAFADPAWLQVDLGGPHTLERVSVDWEAAYSAEYEVQVSDDGKTFKSVHSEHNTRAEIDDITLAASGRFVRIYSTKRGTAWGNSIKELQVFGQAQTSQPGGSVALPARIEAESYQRYYDSTSGNQGDAACSSSNVDAQRTSDADGTCNVGWTDPGEWLEYDVSVAQAASFALSVRLAAGDAGRTLHAEIDGQRVASFSAPSAGWQTFSTSTVSGIKLAAGAHVLRVVFDTGLINLNWLSFAVAADAPPPSRAGCKRGVAYGQHSEADLRLMSKSIAWWYNWDQRPDTQVASLYPQLGLDYVPMVWGSAQIARADHDVPAAGMHTLLGFNEPNFYAQSNLSPEQAAALWPELERIASAKGITRIASPAVNYCGGGCWDTDPVSYLDRFFAACAQQGGCKVDVIAYHAYVCKLEWLTPKIEALYKYAKPIWLTEFACGDSANISEDMQVSYMKDAVPWLEQNPHIERYAWFSGRTNVVPFASLLAGSGAPTRLGQTYLDLAQNSACKLQN